VPHDVLHPPDRAIQGTVDLVDQNLAEVSGPAKDPGRGSMLRIAKYFNLKRGKELAIWKLKIQQLMHKIIGFQDIRHETCSKLSQRVVVIRNIGPPFQYNFQPFEVEIAFFLWASQRPFVTRSYLHIGRVFSH
jgi:hypothetical protein